MKKMLIALAMSCGMAICLAKDVSMVTGADLVAGHAKKEYGYSEAQLRALSKALKGRELTFENGEILTVSKDDDDGSVTAMISFAGFIVNATFSDPATVKFVETLDAGTKVRQLKGRVHYDAYLSAVFELKNAQLKVK